jgi:hypothetical protein
MRTLTRTIPLALAAALIALFGAACGGGGTDSKVDDTAREISNEELAQMVLALEDFGGAYEGFQADDDNGSATLEQRAEDDFDPEGETQDLQQFGWVTGYGVDFTGPQAVQSRAGVYAVGSDVDLFEDAAGASGYFADSAAELAEIAGTHSNGLTVEEVETFDVDVGDEAIGARIKGYVEDDEGSKIDIWASGLSFRHGRLIGSVVFATFDERTFEEGLKGLALVMDERITSVLAAGAAVSDDPSDSGDGSGGASGDLVSAAPLEVLSTSAESFQEEVESLRMEMEFTVNAGGFVVDSTSEMAFQAPDQMHMTMDITGLGSFEMLMLGTDIYMNIPMQGWVVMSMDDLGLGEMGVDAATFQEMFSDHSFVDYAAFVESVEGGIEDLGEETVDGGTYRHYRGTMDFADLSAAFGDAFGATEEMDLENASGPLTFDVWVDPDTFLPYALTASGEFAFGTDTMAFDASMRVFGYNEPVEMPGPPEDAVPFALLGGP